MKASPLSFAIGLASLGLVGLVVFMDLERTSPGPLIATHEAIAELTAPNACALCHGGFGESMAEACSSCHEAVASDITASKGLHGSLAAAGSDVASCGSCHSEHHGGSFPEIARVAFRAAGLSGPEDYDHADLGFGLRGAHAELACAECHTHADFELLDSGEPRFHGLDQACETCHEDVHDGRMARECSACHDQANPFAEVASFRHAEFRLEGPHAAQSCRSCHPTGDAHSIEALSAVGNAMAPRSCADCHDSPHDPGFLARAAKDLGRSEDAACASCHPLESKGMSSAGVHVFRGFEEPHEQVARNAHDASGFPLEPPHEELACADCHSPSDLDSGAEAIAFERRFPGRSPDDCAACHVDPHAEDFAGGPFAGARCLDCHERHAFDPHAFEVPMHDATELALVGRHRSLSCDACHAKSEPVRRFSDAPTACAACHADAHGGRLDEAMAVVSARSRGKQQGCGVCHTPHSFSRIRDGAFDHAFWTGFPLDGMHAEADCEACHPRSEAADESGRTFGRAKPLLSGATGPVGACSSCHLDAHAGAFASRADASCERCHTAHGFDQVRPGSFDHGEWTSFALEGAHAATDCESCHPRTRLADASGRTFGRAIHPLEGPVGSCSSCHADPHGRAFTDGRAKLGRVPLDCARCHGQEAFAPALDGAFDHAAWTGFAIDGAHAGVACASCHPASPPAGDAATLSPRLGPARGRACEDCHTDPHAAQFAIRGRTDCARCHDDFGSSTFDHQRDSRFVLDESHSRLACAACHVPWPLPGGGQAVRYKPLGTRCIDCHAFPGGPGSANGGEGER